MGTENLRLKTGFIAFCDILGYQSFLENNSVSQSIGNVLGMINEVPKELHVKATDFWKELLANEAYLEKLTKALTKLVFSDTIVVSMECQDIQGADWEPKAFLFFMYYVSRLFGEMFFKGLPMRVAITKGEFVFDQSCVAGKALIDTYKLCHSLDFSGLVFHQNMESTSPAILNPLGNRRIRYLSPINHSTGEMKLLHFNWIPDWVKNNKILLQTDIETSVYKSFWAHNKDCGLEVESKLKNTVKLMRRLLIEWELKSQAEPRQVNEGKK